MWYVGGKFRQAKHIAAYIASAHSDVKVYCEPFCGAMGSATTVIQNFPGAEFVLFDINPWLMYMWQCSIDGWNPLPNPTELVVL